MPIWDFQCNQLDCTETKRDVYQPLQTSLAPSCPVHRSAMDKAYSLAVTHIPGGTYPYMTRNITKDGKPVEVRSAAHLKDLCKQHGVTHRDDNAYIEKSYEGYDIRTGKQKYRESSGAGLPGSWE